MNTLTTQLQLLKSNGVSLSTPELLRYQQLAKLFSLVPKRAPQAKLAGSYLTKHKGRGMEFDEARHYEEPDSTHDPSLEAQWPSYVDTSKLPWKRQPDAVETTSPSQAQQARQRYAG